MVSPEAVELLRKIVAARDMADECLSISTLLSVIQEYSMKTLSEANNLDTSEIWDIV